MNNKVEIKKVKTSKEYTVLSISGKLGDHLSQHKVDLPALLLVKNGSITYRDDENTVQLSADQVFDIPANVLHKVTCTSDASFFVVLTNSTIMKFVKNE